MSLNWNISKIRNSDELYTEDKSDLRVRTRTIIFMCMSVGIGEITEKNYEEWYQRASDVETVDGAHMFHDGKPAYLTLEDVKRHIGLKTNVFPKVSKTAFEKRLHAEAMERLRRQRTSDPHDDAHDPA